MQNIRHTPLFTLVLKQIIKLSKHHTLIIFPLFYFLYIREKIERVYAVRKGTRKNGRSQTRQHK